MRIVLDLEEVVPDCTITLPHIQEDQRLIDLEQLPQDLEQLPQDLEVEVAAQIIDLLLDQEVPETIQGHHLVREVLEVHLDLLRQEVVAEVVVHQEETKLIRD